MPKLPFTDPVIQGIANRADLKLPAKSNDIYLDLIEAIISQQLSGRVAKAIFNRFVQSFSEGYPSPQAILSTHDDNLKRPGLSNAKVKYVKNLAEFALSNDVGINHIERMTDEQIISYLTQVKGIGRWTVEMILIFSLQRPDVFPIDDLAIKKGMVINYNLASHGKQLAKDMHRIADRWRPHRTLGTLYIWKYFELEKSTGVS
jgi:DNA-3-methyladenine glycosylase II